MKTAQMFFEDCVGTSTSETISDSAECSMHSSDAELITPFLYNPCRSLLVCIDLGSQLGILMRHKLSGVYVL